MGFAALMALSMLVALLPPFAVSPARSQTPAPPEAVWRVIQQSWTETWADGDDAQPVNITDVDFPTPDLGFAVLGGSGARGETDPTILRTEDGGRTWTLVLRGGGPFEAVEFLDDTSGVAAGISQIWRTTDGGDNWSPVFTAEGSNRDMHIYDVAYVTEGSGPTPPAIVAVGNGIVNSESGAEKGGVLRSLDGGDTWEIIAFPSTFTRADPSMHAIDFATASGASPANPLTATGVAVGESGLILRTIDGGANWSEVREWDFSNHSTLQDVAFAPGGDLGVADLGVAVGDEGTILRSTDRGQSWSAADVTNDRESVEGAVDHFTGVALELSRDGLVGYVVGASAGSGFAVSQISILEMHDPEGTHWRVAPVDQRSRSTRATAVRLSAVAVAVDDGGEAPQETTIAVGESGLIVERQSFDDPQGLADAFTEEGWSQCLPGGAPRSEVPPQVPDSDAVPRFDDPASPTASEVCGGRPDASTGTGNPPSGPTRAGPCRLSEGDQVEAEFPCLRTWRPIDEKGTRHEGGVQSRVFFDEDFAGAGRRVVVLRKRSGTGAMRVYLFDPDRLEQRGADGFGGFRSGATTEGTFDAPSSSGFASGVVNLADAPADSAVEEAMREVTNIDRVEYDPSRERLFLPTHTRCGAGSCIGVSPQIVTFSLRSEFAPTVTALPAIENPSDGPRQAGRTNAVVRSLAFDPAHQMLYVLAESRHYEEQVFGLPQTTATTIHVALHAYDAADGLERRWSVPFEDRCNTTSTLPYLGVSADGDALAFACAGHAFPQFGRPSFEPNNIITVHLRMSEGRHPRDLDAADPTQVAVRVEPVAGEAIAGGDNTFGVDARNLLIWKQDSGSNLWDFDDAGWLGAVPEEDLSTGGDGFGVSESVKHPWKGRLYLPCSRCVDSGDALLLVDTRKLPVESITKTLDVRPGLDTAPLVAVPPSSPDAGRPRLLAAGGEGTLDVYEDRVDPVLPARRLDADALTNDIPEDEAVFVDRRGEADAYGVRVWWTGLGTASPGACRFGFTHFDLTAPCGSPALTYQWLFDRDSGFGPGVGGDAIPFGEHTSALPARPGGGQRELRLGDVRNVELQNSTSQAQAVGVFYDGGPADDSGGNTGDDLKRRRGARDLHDFADTEVGWFTGPAGAEDGGGLRWDGSEAEMCSRAGDDEQQCRDQHDDFRQQHQGNPDNPDDEGFDGQFGPYEVVFDEGLDRLMREVDGDRRVEGGCAPREDRSADGKIDEKDNSGRFEQADDPDTPENEADCWEEFDRNDPRCGRNEEGHRDCDGRGSVERDVGVALPARCLGTGDDERRGSQVSCDVADAHTAASAGLHRLSIVPGEDRASGYLSMGETSSDVELFRHPDDGLVAEITASASDIEFGVEGRASVRIGEVRSTARAHAMGRPETSEGKPGAASWIDVSYQDVEIRGPLGKLRFACGRGDPESGSTPRAGDDPNLDRDGDGDQDAADAIHAAGQAPDERTSGPGERSPDAAPETACDPQRVVDVINTLFTGRVQATTAQPDTDPETRGSNGGAQAIVQRDPAAVISDEVVNRVEGLLALPALKLEFFNDGFRANRLQVGFAGVYAETKYEIGRRAIPGADHPTDPGAVQVDLADVHGAPLAGGEFTLFEDTDGDGQVGDADVPVRECRTSDAGSCVLGGVEPGSYLVGQRAAPAGFLRAEESVGVFVTEGATETVEFVNAPSSAGVEVLLVDPSGRPLAGGEFGLVADAGQDGAVDPNDRVVATCMTGEAGTCEFSGLPLGVYVLHQGQAPSGFKATDDVPFALRSLGQVARIKVVNGPAVAGATVEIIEVLNARKASDGDSGGLLGMVPKVFANILLRNWKQALLFGLTAALFGAPLYLAVRRRELTLVRRGR